MMTSITLFWLFFNLIISTFYLMIMALYLIIIINHRNMFFICFSFHLILFIHWWKLASIFITVNLPLARDILVWVCYNNRPVWLQQLDWLFIHFCHYVFPTANMFATENVRAETSNRLDTSFLWKVNSLLAWVLQQSKFSCCLWNTI